MKFFKLVCIGERKVGCNWSYPESLKVDESQGGGEHFYRPTRYVLGWVSRDTVGGI